MKQDINKTFSFERYFEISHIVYKLENENEQLI
jgi:hypothetical protein